MVPTEKIIETAIKENVDVIGLSGLITPSLDEMIYVAKEMERRGLKIPLLIGGATTSRVHTAVKISPSYSQSVIHVLDASRAVPVVSQLISENEEERKQFELDIKAEYETVRTNYEKHNNAKTLLSLEAARANNLKLDFNEKTIAQPAFEGVKVINNIPLKDVVPFIDWTPFFQTWELHGKYPNILTDEVVGEQATHLFKDAQELLHKMVNENALQINAVLGIFKAHRDGDDIILPNENKKFITLRQQTSKTSSQPNALADRLAEAGAEYLHKYVRTELWGYEQKDALSNQQLIDEEYRGIRPAPGYPACPDHLEKHTIWQLLDVEKNTGIVLTESLAMHPAASVSGYYFAHPDSKYFGLGKITQEQVSDYAERKNISLTEASKWLSPNII